MDCCPDRTGFHTAVKAALFPLPPLEPASIIHIAREPFLSLLIPHLVQQLCSFDLDLVNT